MVQWLINGWLESEYVLMCPVSSRGNGNTHQPMTDSRDRWRTDWPTEPISQVNHWPHAQQPRKKEQNNVDLLSELQWAATRPESQWKVNHTDLPTLETEETDESSVWEQCLTGSESRFYQTYLDRYPDSCYSLNQDPDHTPMWSRGQAHRGQIEGNQVCCTGIAIALNRHRHRPIYITLINRIGWWCCGPTITGFETYSQSTRRPTSG